MSAQPNPLPGASQNDTGTSPVHDPAEGILAGDLTLTDQDRESLWDIFHNSRDPNELAQKLQVLAIPSDTKHALWQAKSVTAPVPSAVDKVTAALQKIKTLDNDTLEMAEKYPSVSKALVDAAIKPPEAPKGPAGKPAGKTEATGKGKTAQTAAPLVQPPRVDGMPHLPPIPEGHYRILASDRSVHDIPADSLEKARQIDPRLHVLNP